MSTKNNNFFISAALVALLVSLMLSGCEAPGGQQHHPLQTFTPYTSFRDIPGVTDDEIRAIEAFQKQNLTFIYGMLPSSEAFIRENGEVGGFATLVRDWLTTLFDIPFKLELYEWGDLLAGLERHEIDFTSELTPTEQRRESYYMTDAIIKRPVKYIRLVDSAPLASIAALRPLRFAFLTDSVIVDAVAQRTQRQFTAIFVDSFDAAYAALKSGQADAFLAEGSTEASFDAYHDVLAADFFPLILSPVSLATQNPSLEPLISVVQKALQHGAALHLAELYKLGQQDYLKHRLFTQLTAQERAHIHDRPVVRFAAEYYNYPISFYNPHEKQWQGIAFDVIKELEKLTGLSFERANDQYTAWPDLLNMLENGTVSMITELLPTEERAGRFLWPKTVLLWDNYALLSKSDFPDIRVSEVQNVRVGLPRATAYSELFQSWFPDHADTVEYESSAAALLALDRGDVDMVMSSQRRLLALTNYHELSNYKANITFELAAQSTFGFNKNEDLLHSIVDKTLTMIDVQGIAAHWVHKTYDYKGRLAREQRPWLIGVSVLLMSVLILLFILFQRKRLEGKELEDLVHERTRELEMRTAELDGQHSMVSTVNDAAVFLLKSSAEDYREALQQSMAMVCSNIQSDRMYLWQNIRKDDGRLFYRQVCKWSREDLEMDDTLWEFSYQDTLPSWETLLSRGMSLNGPLDELPEGKNAFFPAYQIQSLLVVPLFLKDEFWGFVSLDDCQQRRVFPESEEHLLRSWGLLAVGAIQRGEIAQDMQQTLTKLEAVINNYKGVIWSVNNEGVITTFSGQYLKVIGIEPSFLEGKKLEIARLKNRHLDIIQHVEKTFQEGPQSWTGEIDGGVFQSHTVPIRDDKDSIIGVVGSTDDVTATVKLQRDLESAVEAARVASRSKSAFLANMSHEIRTPMNAILGITELQLQNETLAPNIREAFGGIYNAGDLLLSIINDILDLSKIEAGKLELLPAEYDLASLINDTMQLHLMRIGSKPVEFELHVDESTPAVVVGDALRVKQVLNNVLSNAFKYTAKGMVTLSVSHEAGGGDSHPQGELSTRESGQEETDVMLVFRVSDTGQGMKAEQVAKLFDEYTRFNLETNNTITGTGLGMNITLSLVRQMKGEILVESTPGKGSTFTVRLPQGKVGPEVLGREQVDALRQFRLNDTAYMQRAQIVREPMPYGSVLVVDDVATNLYVARGLLASYGLKIDSAESGFEALEKIEEGKVYDIVFMDHMMPGMDGMETTYVLRTRGYTQPIVALTANAMLGQADVFRESGFDDFIAKPIDLRQMNVVLNKYVRDRHPPEVIEAARRQKNDTDARTADVRPQALADPKLAKIFIRDASTSLAVLETLCEKQDASYSDEDIRAYIVNTHGIKSALANIGELELSALASKLEQAGRDRDSTVMSSETPAFLDALRKLIEKITPKEDDESSDITDEDRAYLREKLLALKAACVAYNKKAAKDTLAEIEQKAWPRPTKELLDTIAEQLLHSKFKGLASTVDEALLAL